MVHALTEDYGAGNDQCSEFCLMEMAFAFVAVASKGGCAKQGYETSVKKVIISPNRNASFHFFVIMFFIFFLFF